MRMARGSCRVVVGMTLATLTTSGNKHMRRLARLLGPTDKAVDYPDPVWNIAQVEQATVHHHSYGEEEDPRAYEVANP